jgi:hypothetical protein
MTNLIVFKYIKDFAKIKLVPSKNVITIDRYVADQE